MIDKTQSNVNERKDQYIVEWHVKGLIRREIKASSLEEVKKYADQEGPLHIVMSDGRQIKVSRVL